MEHAVSVHLMLPWHYKEDRETYEEWSLICVQTEGWKSTLMPLELPRL